MQNRSSTNPIFLNFLDNVPEHGQHKYNDDHIVMIRVNGDGIRGSYYQAEEVAIIDTTERWPRDGGLCLISMKYDKDKYIYSIRNIYYSVKGFKLFDPNKPDEQYFKELTDEEIETRVVSWIVGRLLGTTIVY